MKIKTDDLETGAKHEHRVVTPGRRVARGLLHVPVGAFGAWLYERDVPAAKAFALGFAYYEYIEEKVEHDKAHMDYIGWLFGFAGYKLARWAMEKAKRKGRGK